ncbi:MAG: D-proline reductase (dithiol) PrdB [Cellvibrionaceae bacterium]|jgi:D-proline reductase (dithiol) PrdB
MNAFTPAYRIAVSYIDKSRKFYAHKGFTNPYRWATHAEAPLATLTKPLSESRIAVVTTVAPNEEGGQREQRKVWSAASDSIPETLHTHHLSWHKTATHTRDLGTFLPLRHLQSAADSGKIGSLGPRFYSVPTTYSQRQTSSQNAPAILEMCREDQVDAVILIPL